MNATVYKLLIPAMIMLAVGATQPAAQGSCVPNWTSNDYKSFGTVQSEIRTQYGDVRILRVELCQQGGDAYFQVVIISGQGEVQRVKLAAAAK
ncbi:MAG: hypothetical protein ACFCUR_03255 [Rhodomicrobiaceae bacterium]